MAIAANSSIYSSLLSAGRALPLHCQSCQTDDLSSFGWKTVMHEGHKLGATTHSTCRCAIRFDSGSQSFGSSDCFQVFRAKKLLHTKVQVAADYSDSKSGAFENHDELGYHPLEEISEGKNPEGEQLRMSDAEIARSTVEANNSAILVHPGIVHRESHEAAPLTELQYVIDDHGEIYFELNNDENILRSPRARNPVNVFIGLDDLQIYGEQKRMAFEYYNSLHTDNSSDTTNKDIFKDWSSTSHEEDDLEHSEPLRDWTKLDTMTMGHPMYFSKRIAKVVSSNYSEKMDRPSNGIAIIGLLRPALMEEEYYLRKFLYDADYSSGDDNYIEEDQPSNAYLADEGDNLEWENIANSKYMDITADPDLMSMMLPEDEATWPLVSESDSEPRNSSLFKLEILSIRLISVYGNQVLPVLQSVVSLEDFQQAEPDILANSSSAIIAHFSAGGGKIKRALRTLCRKKHGLDVEDATLIGVDSLGVDLRVHCGAKVQTVRVAFNYRATSESAAKRQLQRLLYPHFHHRRKSRGNCSRDR